MKANSLFLPILIAGASLFTGCSVRRPTVEMSAENKKIDMLCKVDEFMAKQAVSNQSVEFVKPRGSEILTREKLSTANKRETIRFIVNAQDSVLYMLHGISGAHGKPLTREPIDSFKNLTGNSKELVQIGLNEFHARKKPEPALAISK